MPVQMDFVHATRYAGQTEGGEIEFRVPPRLNLEGQDVLIVDDIYDIGLTLQMIEEYCVARGARRSTAPCWCGKFMIVKPPGSYPNLLAWKWKTSTFLAVGWMPMNTGGTWMRSVRWRSY